MVGHREAIVIIISHSFTFRFFPHVVILIRTALLVLMLLQSPLPLDGEISYAQANKKFTLLTSSSLFTLPF